MEVRPCRFDEVDNAGNVLARAFSNDPFVKMVVPKSAARETVLKDYCQCLIRYGIMYGEVYIHPLPLNGVAVWFPVPGSEMTSERATESGFNRAAEIFGRNAWSQFEEVSALLDGIRTSDAPRHHWYLAALGVEPESIGSGIGGGLLSPIFEVADEQQVACYAETAESKNSHFYINHGFSTLRSEVPITPWISFSTYIRKPRNVTCRFESEKPPSGNQ